MANEIDDQLKTAIVDMKFLEGYRKACYCNQITCPVCYPPVIFPVTMNVP